MSKSFLVSVEPGVLIWARCGMNLNDVARKIKEIPATTIENWEKGKANPTFSQLERLASIYKRPMTAFLLPIPPKEPPFPTDYRTLPSENKKPLHPKTYLAIRKARRFQYSAVELIKELGEPIKKLSIMANLSDNPEALAEKMRIELGVKDFPRFASFTIETALEEWIKILEKNGIFVFQISITQNKEIRGLSLVDEDIPVVILRRSDEPSAKIFTLFHEFAHLLLREGGICDLEEDETQKIEKFCNHFAGAFLVPKNELLNHPVVKANEKRKEWPDHILKDITQDFKVSKEVILRRLLILGLTTKEYYHSKHEEWKREYKEPIGRGKKNEIKICIQERGKQYVSMVFEAYKRNKIDNMSVADYLGVELDKITKVKEAI